MMGTVKYLICNIVTIEYKMDYRIVMWYEIWTVVSDLNYSFCIEHLYIHDELQKVM